MASKVVFDAMEAKDWIKVRELIATTTSWTPQDLEKKHGVRREELALVADDTYLKDFVKSVFAVLSFIFLILQSVFVFLVCMFLFFFCTPHRIVVPNIHL